MHFSVHELMKLNHGKYSAGMANLFLHFLRPNISLLCTSSLLSSLSSVTVNFCNNCTFQDCHFPAVLTNDVMGNVFKCASNSVPITFGCMMSAFYSLTSLKLSWINLFLLKSCISCPSHPFSIGHIGIGL